MEPSHNEWGCASANGIVVLAEDLEVFRLRAIVACGRKLPSGSLSFFEKDLDWMDAWGFNPERLASH
jgi:hypothetical protein